MAKGEAGQAHGPTSQPAATLHASVIIPNGLCFCESLGGLPAQGRPPSPRAMLREWAHRGSSQQHPPRASAPSDAAAPGKDRTLFAEIAAIAAPQPRGEDPGARALSPGLQPWACRQMLFSGRRKEGRWVLC